MDDVLLDAMAAGASLRLRCHARSPTSVPVIAAPIPCELLLALIQLHHGATALRLQ
jgi:hypothetical protein